jgi:anti-sigma28 factor (negative regulator of flagellin synthesis)
MRIIDSNNIGHTGAAEAGRAGEAKTVTDGKVGRSNKGSSGAGGDSLQLSGLAGRISSALQADSVSHSRRLSELSAAVRSGNYQVDSHAVSRALVDRAIAGSAKL